MKLKYEIFVQRKPKNYLLNLGSSKNCMSSAKLVAETQPKYLNERASSIGEPSACDYVDFLQSFYRGTLSIHWSITQMF